VHVGLITGIGPAATDHYYRALIAASAASGRPLDLTMAHADMPTLMRNLGAGDAAAQAAIYVRLTSRLKAAGAEAVAITSIGGSFCMEAFRPVSPLPVIDIMEEVDRALVAAGVRRAGIIGTRAAMESRLYGRLTATELISPDGAALAEVHDAYVAMATAGAATAGQREVMFRAGRALMARGAETVLLGGTDLALAFAGQDPGFPVFDCAAVHATAIAAWAAR
jgi:aspartate racemase